MSNLYVYVLEVFAYSDFEYYLLAHEQKFSKDEFFRMIEFAKGKSKKFKTHNLTDYERKNYGYFPYNIINILKEEFGFKNIDVPIAYIGTNIDSKTTVV